MTKITQTVKDKCLDECAKWPLIRSQERVKELGEVFTPTALVLEILEQLPEEVWEDGKTFLDPTCGNGQFLSAALITKISLNHNNPLSTIYGVDIKDDNVNDCRERLLAIAGNTEENKKIVLHNIRCEDGLKYDYSFKSIDEEIFAEKIETTKKLKQQKVKPVKEDFPSGLFG